MRRPCLHRKSGEESSTILTVTSSVILNCKIQQSQSYLKHTTAFFQYTALCIDEVIDLFIPYGDSPCYMNWMFTDLQNQAKILYVTQMK